jgi:hypothetical protein
MFIIPSPLFADNPLTYLHYMNCGILKLFSLTNARRSRSNLWVTFWWNFVVLAARRARWIYFIKSFRWLPCTLDSLRPRPHVQPYYSWHCTKKKGRRRKTIWVKKWILRKPTKGSEQRLEDPASYENYLVQVQDHKGSVQSTNRPAIWTARIVKNPALLLSRPVRVTREKNASTFMHS